MFLESISRKVRFFPPIHISDFCTARLNNRSFPFNLDPRHLRFTFNGSAAIFQAARLLKLGPGDKVLVPAYCCGAELGPFQHLGCQIDFYRIGDDLQFDLEDLEGRIDRHTRLVYTTHYYGLPQHQIEELAEICSIRRVAMLEDCALALFSNLGDRPLGSFGDFAIFSQRKYLPITEGGLLVSNRTPLPEALRRGASPPWLPALDRLANLVVQGVENQTARTFLGAASLLVKIPRTVGQGRLETWRTPEVEGSEAVAIYEYGMTPWMENLLRATDAQSVVQQRRQNFYAWLEIVERLPECKPLIAILPEGICPLYFLIVAENKQDLVQRLCDRGIEASEWWSAELQEIDWTEHENLLALKSQLVVVPVHHRLDRTELFARTKDLTTSESTLALAHHGTV